MSDQRKKFVTVNVRDWVFPGWTFTGLLGPMCQEAFLASQKTTLQLNNLQP